MNVSRNFIVAGAAYLLVGLLIGMHMGASGNHDLMPVHAHINLLGFTLMTLFGLVYRVFPAASESALARIHFWLHLAGSLILLVMLFLLMSGRIGESAMVPLAPLAEGLVFIGVALFFWNVLKNVK